MTESSQMETPLDSPGLLLAEARRAKQLSTDDVAKRLCLKVNIIEALEKDELLPSISLTFIKGYTRSYAKLLGLDEVHIITLFNDFHASETLIAPKKMQSFSRKVAKENNDSRWMLVTYSLIAVVLILIVIWWSQQNSENFFASPSSVPALNSSEADLPVASTTEQLQNTSTIPSNLNEKQTTNSLDSVDSISSNGDLAGNLPEESILTESLLTETLPTETSSLEEPSVAMLTEQNNSLESNDLNQVEQETIPDFVPDKVQGNIAQVLDLLENDAPDVESELRLFDDDMSASNDVEIVELMFTFSNDCWIKITDATGNDIAYGVKKQGRVMPVSGQPPFSVILGAPASVKVNYAGEPVDISFLPSDRTGRFVLPLQE
ncbi:RodZ domain-containing protein [Glaciecola sp. HTCC2999]|jgi:cytoskeleton protein RodZ|uniref:RodZ domain-containing protein n=1 Tax=Glaciecola sp. HTCC2999 TaxID=455436 RepID=UPI0000E0F4D9|nr:RodZ domain-containing protein [Glaciecola sp. HTCC2999]